MNNCDSMGDDQVDMGLQKIDMPTFERRSLSAAVKEKRRSTSAAFNLLNNWEHEMCRNGTNLPQDCEEIWKIMEKTTNTLPAAATGAPLTNGSNQLYSGKDVHESHDSSTEQNLSQTDDDDMVAVEERVGCPQNEVSEPETVDHMADLRLPLIESQSSLPQTQSSDTAPADADTYADTINEGRKRCLQMERRIDRLARRLKLKQSQVYGVHTSEQISGLLDYCRCKFVDMSKAPAAQPATDVHSQSMLGHHLNNYNNGSSNSVSGRCGNRTTSTTSMDLYLKRLKRCSDQSCVPQNSEKFLRYFGSGTKESHKSRNITSSVAPKFSDDLYEHIEKISGRLHAQIKAITNDFDSDLTASSSGNDSLDEEIPLTPETMEDRSKKIPLCKRALWRWLRHRASIAYRLSWLQSHMSALEYTIHHYTEIHKKLRNAKGPVVLQSEHSAGNHIPATTVVVAKNGPTNGHSFVLNGFHGSLTVAANVDSTDGGEAISCSCVTASSTFTTSSSSSTSAAPATVLTTTTSSSSSSTCYTTSSGINSTTAPFAVNAALSPRPDKESPASVDGDSNDESCSRTYPLLRSKFRRRNLIRLNASGVAAANNGVAAASSLIGRKFASVRCSCVPPLTCVLCVRRGLGVDLSNQHIYANLLPIQSKIALLEPTYHPVLSFPSDVSVSTHVSALLNNDDVLEVCAKTIENRTAAQMPTKRHYPNYKSTEEIRRSNAEGLTEFKRRKKYAKRPPNNSQAVPFGRSQLSKQRHSKLDKAISSFRKRRRKRLRSKRVLGNENGLYDSADDGLYYKKEDVYSSQPGSPHSSHSSTVKDPMRRKRGQSFDIDNFIIPPNSTPAVVASKPQYKEILIPRWKIVEEKSISIEDFNRNLLQEHILEDLCDDNIVRLHEMMEQNERKKFRTNSTRNRSRKRTDSCPETSEANTPERMASPVPSNVEQNDLATTSSSNVNIAFPNAIASNQTNVSVTRAKNPNSLLNKSRTSSMDCDNSSVTAEPISVELVAPYELREFPLSDEAFKELHTSLHGKIEEFDPDDESTNDSKAPEMENRVKSLVNGSTDSDSEDPDDPDWMLSKEDEKHL